MTKFQSAQIRAQPARLIDCKCDTCCTWVIEIHNTSNSAMVLFAHGPIPTQTTVI